MRYCLWAPECDVTASGGGALANESAIMQRKTHLYYNGRRRREQNGHMTIFCKANLVGGVVILE